MMVWVQDDASRDTYNRMRLVYSLYDAENDSWSEPKAVYDDGHNDAYPSLATDGENVYITWQKIDKTVTESDSTSVDVFLENSEIFVAKYDATNNHFVNATKLTDNNLYKENNQKAQKQEEVLHKSTCLPCSQRTEVLRLMEQSKDCTG